MLIDMGRFGNAIAQPAGAPRLDPRAAGGQVAEAIEQVGRTGMAIAAEEMRRQDEQKEMAERAREAALRNQTLDGLTDLADEIAEGIKSGAVPKDNAEQTFRERSQTLLSAASEGLRPQSRDVLMPSLTSSAERYGNHVRKAREQRDRQDVTAGISQTLEYTQRLYKTDPDAATTQAMEVINSLGPFSTLSPDQLSKLGQRWKEDTQFVSGYEAVSAGRDSKPLLAEAEKRIASLPDLSPEKRAQLNDRISAYRMAIDQRQEMAAQRAAREQERRLKVAEAEFVTFQTIADKGTVLDPSYVDRALKATAGTPYQAGIRAIAQQAVETGGLAAQRIEDQRTELARLDAQIAQHGRSPELDKRRSQVEKVLRGSEEDAREDPMRAALSRGVVTELAPLDMSNPQALVAGLTTRLAQAQRVSVWAGQDVTPLTAPEAANLKRMLDVLPPAERSSTIALLSTTIGPSASTGLAKQLDKEDKPLALAFALAGSATTQGRYTSELVLRGANAIKDKTAAKDDAKLTGWKATISRELEGVFPNEVMTAATRDAAYYITAGIAHENGGSASQRDIERAVRLAVGGDLIEHNGRKIPLPAGVDEDMLDKRLRTITAEEVSQQAQGPNVRAAGVEIPAQEWVKTLPGAELAYAGPGRYYVLVGGRPVTSADGKRRISITVRQ